MIILGWDKWQTYRKDRGTPPWIKVHRNLMSNPEWVCLTDAEKGQLVSMWIIAADKNGALPDCPNTIKKMCLLDEVPNIKRFVDLQFVKLGDASMTTTWLPCGCQSDAPDTEKPKPKPKNSFIKPSVAEVAEYCKKRSNSIDAEQFFNHYEANGWVQGKNKPLKNWQAAVRTWEKNSYEKTGPDGRSRAKKFADTLDEIAAKDIAENGNTDFLG